MKRNTWVGAVVILAAMVFVLTFAMNYLGPGRTPVTAEAKALPRLTFATPTFPPDNAPPMECEFKQPAHYDFWFCNENDKELPFGLATKSCKCASVEVFLLPESQRPQLLALAASRLALAGAAGPLSVQLMPEASLPRVYKLAAALQTIPLAAAQDAKTLRDLAKVEGVPLTTENSVVVPAGGLGWVRLHWKTERVESRILGLELWTDQKNNPTTTNLSARASIVLPLEMPTEMEVGTLTPSSLQGDKPKTLYFYCFSRTRPEVRFKAEVVHDTRKPASDPFTVGAPERVTDAELQHIAEKANAPYLRCSYRVPVTLHPAAPDGTPFELGHFRRFVAVRMDGEDTERPQVAISGLMEGEVTVGQRGEGGWVYCGPFDADKGTKVKTTVQSDTPGLELEVDQARLPSFLEVKLGKPEEVPSSGHRSWVLEIHVKPDQVAGKFPNPEDETLRDCAIYLKTKGKNPRTIRIPVTGTATEVR
jgi:hypothetical protein